MPFFIIVIVVIIVLVNKAKAARANGEEAKKRQAFITELEQQAAQESVRPAPQARSVVQPTVRSQIQSRVTQGHVVMPSNLGGHAHVESSMTGIQDCPPEFGKPSAGRITAFNSASKKRTTLASSAGAESGVITIDDKADAKPFRFDPAEARNGLIYAEILGKPKALRGR